MKAGALPTLRDGRVVLRFQIRGYCGGDVACECTVQVLKRARTRREYCGGTHPTACQARSRYA